MTVINLQSESERSRRREFVRDSKAAVQQGRTLEARTAAREAMADAWAKWLHERMDSTGCSDPVELLPDILARVEQLAEDRVAGAVVEIKTTLRKALT